MADSINTEDIFCTSKINEITEGNQFDVLSDFWDYKLEYFSAGESNFYVFPVKEERNKWESRFQSLSYSKLVSLCRLMVILYKYAKCRPRWVPE